jgi:hypothetical protein
MIVCWSRHCQPGNGEAAGVTAQIGIEERFSRTIESVECGKAVIFGNVFDIFRKVEDMRMAVGLCAYKSATKAMPGWSPFGIFMH